MSVPDVVAGVYVAPTLICILLISILLLLPRVSRVAIPEGYKQVGLGQTPSNLKCQGSHIHQPQPDRKVSIQSLFIYPVKSCRGIELSRSRVLPSGLEFDRLYTFAKLRDLPKSLPTVGGETGRVWEFLTQRQLPLLANVKIEIWLKESNKKIDGNTDGEGGLILVRFPWKDAGLRGILQWFAAKVGQGIEAYPEKSFLLPLEFPSKTAAASKGYEYAAVKIWKDTTTALNFERDMPLELRIYLGLKDRLGLFRMDPTKQREVHRCAPTKQQLGYQPVVDFHDAYPLHLLSLTSLQEFESRIQKDRHLQSLDARRFRSNIIVSGSEAYDEETWRSIQCASLTAEHEQCSLDVSCRTVRCKMPNVDPANGIRHAKEPDFSLRKHRDVDQGAPKLGCLGMQLCPVFPNADGAKTLSSFIEVGMEIDVLQRGSHMYMKQ